MTTPFPPGVEVTYLVLGRALDEALEVGLRVPCRETPGAFFAETAADRRAAAVLCGDCPVLQECVDFAEAASEGWGVWGGRDRETPSRRLYRHGARQGELDLGAAGVAS